MLAGLALIAVLISKTAATLPSVATGRGLITGDAPISFFGGYISFLLALLATGLIMGLMVFVNTTFNMLRSSSLLYLGIFATLTAASPIISTRVCSGMLVAIVVLVAMALFYSVYQRRRTCTKRVFLVFFLLSAGSMAQYAFLAYLPVFLAGCVQMRCFTFRSLLAALAGIAVPWWILWGFGLIDLSSISLPIYASVFSQLDGSDIAQLGAVIAATVITGLTLTLLNLYKVYSYNARSRSFTGLLVTVTIATILLSLIDFTNITAYLTLLNCCVAYQTALWFKINASNRGYIIVLTILAIYLTLYVWSLVI